MMTGSSRRSRHPSQHIYDRLCILASERLTLPPGALARLRPGTPIVEGLQLDSLAQVTFLAALEDEFKILLEPEDRDGIVTVEDLIAAIQERLVTKPGASIKQAGANAD